MQHCPSPSGLFNHLQQSRRLGMMPTGAYIISSTVVHGALRLFSEGLFKSLTVNTCQQLCNPTILFVGAESCYQVIRSNHRIPPICIIKYPMVTVSSLRMECERWN